MDQKVMEVFEDAGVLQKGHFLLSSGKHSDTYLQCARLFEYHRHSEFVSKRIADYFKDKDVDLVIGPAVGGILLSYEVARVLDKKNIFAEKQDGKMMLRRGFKITPGQKVLVVEDVVTTGGSVKRVIELVKECKGQVVGVGVVVDRSKGRVDFGTDFYSVAQMDVISYPQDECPICKQGVSLVRPGSGSSIGS
ncbi:MAG: orotate phosphoribosyltransferase [Clostridia bacterium]|nr:orotate phosphoribosyltransferase [Clostridia bacterium]